LISLFINELIKELYQSMKIISKIKLHLPFVEFLQIGLFEVEDQDKM